MTTTTMAAFGIPTVATVRALPGSSWLGPGSSDRGFWNPSSEFKHGRKYSCHPMEQGKNSGSMKIHLSNLKDSMGTKRRGRTKIRAGVGDEPGTSGEEDDGLDVEAKFRMQTTDWRAFRARLVRGAEDGGDGGDGGGRGAGARWAHALAEPEKGCLLIAHPSAFGSRQTYFNQAVIFLFAHGEEGSAGFILNRPTGYALGQVPGFEEFGPEFADARLYMGGDVGTNLIQVVHGVPGLRDSKEVIAGVYLGSPTAVRDSVKCGDTRPDDYRWFLGYCGWRPGQLEREVAHGVWYLASSSRDVVTDQCIRLKRPLWRQVLELMGGEYSAISRRAYGEP